MTHAPLSATLLDLDDATRRLVRVAAAAAGATESVVRESLVDALDTVPAIWVEELLLQTHLFAGFPRALNAMRAWRRVSGRPASAAPTPASAADSEATAREERSEVEAGERTCAAVYGSMYERLRANVRALHPELDAWMVADGYGKVLSRPGLDLARRELCIVAACVASGQDRQLHSHLHGSLNVGVAREVTYAAIAALAGIVDAARISDATQLAARVYAS